MSRWKTYPFKLFDFNPASSSTIIQLLQSVEYEIPTLNKKTNKKLLGKNGELRLVGCWCWLGRSGIPFDEVFV
jgi:hypothetical protein